jgi:hypothetical protein
LAQRYIECKQRIFTRLRLTLGVAGDGGFDPGINRQPEQQDHDEREERHRHQQRETASGTETGGESRETQAHGIRVISR